MGSLHNAEGPPLSLVPKDITGDEWVGDGNVLVSVYPDCGEALAVAVPPVRDQKKLLVQSDLATFRVGGTPETAQEVEERELENRARAERRARGVLRRFLVQNLLLRMWTLTYAPPFQTDRAQVVRDVNGFVRRLREYLDEAIPFAYVLELHKDGERWHVHMALPSRFIPHGVVERLWGHGFVQYQDRLNKVGHGRAVMSQRQQARLLAGYLCKYIGKGWDTVPVGKHRYEVAQGFTVKKVRRRVRTFLDAARRVRTVYVGVGDEVREWSLERDPEWRGPPCRGWTW